MYTAVICKNITAVSVMIMQPHAKFKEYNDIVALMVQQRNSLQFISLNTVSVSAQNCPYNLANGIMSPNPHAFEL